MPYTDKEKKEATDKAYRIKNKDRELLKDRRWYYNENGNKSRLKIFWKRYGLNMNNFENIWKRYWNAIECEWCNIYFDFDIRKEMEHNHYTGECRGIVCRSCNMYQRAHDDKFKRVLIQLISKIK